MRVCGMHERTKIHLCAADRSRLEAVVANRNSPQKHVWRARIILLTAKGHGTAEILRATGKAKTVIWRWQERFRDEGPAGLWRDKTRPSGIPPLDPKIAERVVALTLAGAPPAASHWSGAAMARAVGISVSSVQRPARHLRGMVTSSTYCGGRSLIIPCTADPARGFSRRSR
jgi:hypothetical protein